MEPWKSWLLGFGIWCMVVALYALIVLLISRVSLTARKKIPDEAFNYKYRNPLLPKDGFFLDTHTHTLASDGWMTPEQNIRWHIANGFHAMVVTDHNTDRNNQASLDLQSKYPEILIIPGIEWTTPRMHLNFIGIEKYPFKIPFSPTDEDIKDAIQKAKNLGAVVQANHITWVQHQPYAMNGEVTVPTREQLLEWGVDGFEVQNEIRWYDPTTIEWIKQKKESNIIQRPIYQSSGTDIHNPLKEWVCGWTQLLVTPQEQENISIETVKQILREGRTKVWADHDFRHSYETNFESKINYNLFYSINAPSYAILHGVMNIPGTMKGVWIYILWGLFLYIPFRLLFDWILAL